MLTYGANEYQSRPKSPNNAKERYQGLTDQLADTFNAMREIAKTLPADQRRQLEGKIVVAEVTHQALMKEFAQAPK